MASKKNKPLAKKNKKKTHQKLSKYQITILIVILVAMTITVVAVLISFFATPENLVKSNISNLASEYYEEYLYDSLSESENFSGDYKSTLGKYKTTGLAQVTLRQLILHDHEKNASIGNYIKEHCDEEKTTVRFFPEEPYDKANYHIDYHYVCNF